MAQRLPLSDISLIAHAESRIEVRVANNILHDDSDYGILCQGPTAFLLTDLLMNDVARNMKGDIFGSVMGDPFLPVWHRGYAYAPRTTGRCDFPNRLSKM